MRRAADAEQDTCSPAEARAALTASMVAAVCNVTAVLISALFKRSDLAA
jgi:hypothetical protein